jgi:predicted outer membrane repeat protein
VLSTFSVTSAADDGTAGTLRWAIEQANANADHDLISVTPSLNITLTQGVLNVTTPMTISTTSNDYFFLLGNKQSQLIHSNSSLELSWVGMFSGAAESGAAIQNSGTMVLNNCQFQSNSAGSGGGLYNTGTVTLTGCIFVQNTASQGGAIYNSGTASLVSCTFGVDPSTDPTNFNSATGNGGAILNAPNATMTLDGCTLENNSTSNGDGGGIYNSTSATLTLSNSFVQFNRAKTNGGGILNEGSLTVTGTNISNNTAGGSGGGISTLSTLTITNSTLGNNNASVSGGALNVADGSGNVTVTTSTFTNNTSGQDGGAIRNGFTNLFVSQSALASNHASGNGGGIANFGASTVTNSTFHQNTGSDGGGLWNVFAPNAPPSVTSAFAWVRFSTFSRNSTGLYTGSNTSLQLDNSIVAHSDGYDLRGGPQDGVLSSPGQFTGNHNLIGDGQIDFPTSLQGDPMLGAFQDNGGPTWTMALLPGSPAIDGGVNLAGIGTDQRGVTRPQGPAPDLGAFESQGFQTSVVSGGVSAAAATPSTHPVAAIGTAFEAELVLRVTSAFGEPVAGGAVRFVPAPSGASAVFENGGIAAIDAHGHARISATANRVPGTHTIITQTNGANSVAFTHTNIMPNFHGVWRGLLATRTGRGHAIEARLDLTNPGTVPTRGAGVKLYASNDAVLDANDRLLSSRRSIRLRSNAFRVMAWRFGPRQLRAGQYLIAVLDAKHSVDGSGPKRLFHAIASDPSA